MAQDFVIRTRRVCRGLDNAMRSGAEQVPEVEQPAPQEPTGRVQEDADPDPRRRRAAQVPDVHPDVECRPHVGHPGADLQVEQAVAVDHSRFCRRSRGCRHDVGAPALPEEYRKNLVLLQRPGAGIAELAADEQPRPLSVRSRDLDDLGRRPVRARAGWRPGTTMPGSSTACWLLPDGRASTFGSTAPGLSSISPARRLFGLIDDLDTRLAEQSHEVVTSSHADPFRTMARTSDPTISRADAPQTTHEPDPPPLRGRRVPRTGGSHLRRWRVRSRTEGGPARRG